MSKVEPHPFDKGKFQSTFDDYGHGKGNGKSRNAIYKHAKKIEKKNSDFVKSKTPSSSKSVKIDNNLSPEESDFAQNHQVDDELPIWDSDENAQNQEFADWGSVSWDATDETEVVPNTIPRPIAGMAAGGEALDLQATGQMIRLAFLGLDRLVTHWGRGVMMKKDWTLTRTAADYDALETSTVNLMNHYGIQVPVSPLLVWSATVGSAYVPPIMHIRKNAHPSRRRRSILSRLWPFKRKKKVDATQAVQEGERIDPEP